MGNQNFVFSQTIFIGRPAEDVWMGITDKRYVDQYYLVPLGVEKFSKGDEIFYGTEDEKMIAGEILGMEEGSLLSHSFQFLQGEDEDEPQTIVEYRIEPLGEMCILHLTHSGFTKESQTYHDIVGGWPIILSGLKTLLETGQTLPWPDPDAEQDV